MCSFLPVVLGRRLCSHQSWAPPRKVLLLSKVTRYEMEKSGCEGEFRSWLDCGGSELSALKRHHETHKSFEGRILSALEELEIPEVRCVNRLSYSNAMADWADVILTAGGDGTFLMGASKVRNFEKAVIGFNTDPSKSEGYLLLPKGMSPLHALKAAFEPPFKEASPWYFRKRLRITLIGPKDKIFQAPLEFHQQKVTYPEYRYIEEAKNLKRGTSKIRDHCELAIPVLALNEVFIGECLSSRVSCLEIGIDDEATIVSKNSGLCVSTGTGSTSWTFNINKLNPQSVSKILHITQSKTQLPLIISSELVQSVTSQFNNELLFEPTDNVMAYAIRDSISVGTFPSDNEIQPRGVALQKVKVKSMCFDASLVIDGSLSFKFNDGTCALIEMREEDALRTVFFKK